LADEIKARDWSGVDDDDGGELPEEVTTDV
jgi:hypothetical protein